MVVAGDIDSVIFSNSSGAASIVQSVVEAESEAVIGVRMRVGITIKPAALVCTRKHRHNFEPDEADATRLKLSSSIGGPLKKADRPLFIKQVVIRAMAALINDGHTKAAAGFVSDLTAVISLNRDSDFASWTYWVKGSAFVRAVSGQVQIDIFLNRRPAVDVGWYRWLAVASMLSVLGSSGDTKRVASLDMFDKPRLRAVEALVADRMLHMMNQGC